MDLMCFCGIIEDMEEVQDHLTLMFATPFFEISYNFQYLEFQKRWRSDC